MWGAAVATLGARLVMLGALSPTVVRDHGGHEGGQTRDKPGHLPTSWDVSEAPKTPTKKGEALFSGPPSLVQVPVGPLEGSS